MSNIQYRPELEYEKKYTTSGVISKASDSQGTSADEQVNRSINDLSSKLKAIEDALPGLPEGILNAIKTPIAGVRYLLDDIGPGEIAPVATTITKQIVNDNPIIVPLTNKDNNAYIQPIDGLEDIPDEVFPDADGINVNIEIIKPSNTDIIQQEYKYDMACLFTEYIDNMNKVMSNFFSNVIAISEEVNIPSFLDLYAYYGGNSNNISDNLKPMSDYAIRTQVKLDQQIKMYKKLFDVDSMMVNIRACKSAAELRKRYYTADYVPNNDFLAMNQNDLLANTRIEFDKKYTENLYNLYKYLNSSVILIDECMKLELKISQAKAALIKNEGVALQW